MEKFIVTAKASNSENILALKLPESKHFEVKPIENEEKESHVMKLLHDAVQSAIYSDRYYQHHRNPTVSIEEDPKPYPTTYQYFVPTAVPRTLQGIFLNKPFPLSQGPIISPLDCSTEDRKTEVKIMYAKTIFKHHVKQMCMEWKPRISGISSWEGGKNKSCYEASEDLTLKVEGPASTKDMRIIFTCQLNNCIIYCSCSICTDIEESCRMQCKDCPCDDCDRQCTSHSLKLPRLLNLEEDHFTMISVKIDQYRYVVGHAGIPLSCPSCTQDILEHQTLHLIFHVRCKFCRYELRPFEVNKSLTTREEYKSATRHLKRIDGRTCSYCFVTLQDKFARKKHEEAVHEKKQQKYKCEECTKSYSLSYHMRTKHAKQDRNLPGHTFQMRRNWKQITG